MAIERPAKRDVSTPFVSITYKLHVPLIAFNAATEMSFDSYQDVSALTKFDVTWKD